MASSSSSSSSLANVKQSCINCDKGGGIAICSGCQQPYCVKHFIEHRQELTTQMEKIGQDHDLLRRDLTDDIVEHPLFSRIDVWEQESITKIQVAAELARVDLRQLVDEMKTQLKISIDNMTSEIQSSQQLDDYTEIDLKKWLNKLKELRKILEKPVNIDSQFTNHSQTSIELIRIHPRVEPRSRTFQRLNIVYLQERFDKVHGPVMFSENNSVVKSIGNDYSRICGLNEYSSDVHRIDFRVDERIDSCPFLGIISSLDVSSLKKLTLSSANGWSDLDNLVVNGKNLNAGISTHTIQSGDEVTLILDCDNREILLEHHRTNRLVRQLIDIEKCPFPWKILVALSPRSGSIRVLS